MSLLNHLKTGTPVLMDGAMSTELTRKGVRFDQLDWIRANLAHPDIIASLHSAYARAGARIHIANTFATAPHVLEDFGLQSEFEALNRAGVDICRSAITRYCSEPCWIAGSISTFAKDHDRSNLPALDQLELNTAAHATLLADAGCDLIALEMLFDVDHTVAMLRGALAGGLPVSVGLLAETNAHGKLVMKDKVRSHSADTPILFSDAVEQIITAAPASAPLIISSMHSLFEDTGPALEAIRNHWEGPTAVYPNIGRYQTPGGWDLSGAPSPDVFARACEQWAAAGANIIGGCCGVGPDYIEVLGDGAIFNTRP